jgi:DNA-binding transcriptional regulator YiaG
MINWEPVIGLEGHFEVSDTGLVRSLPGRRKKTGRPRKGGLLKPQKWGKYYKFSVDRKVFLIHRMVAQAFVPNPHDLPQVNHKDGNQLNNDAKNLEWVTIKQNMEHAAINLLKVHGEQVHASKLTAIQVGEIRISRGLSQKDLAKKYGVSVTTIQQILYRKTWKHI